MNFIILILSLPTENTTVRMRAWRALKSSGAVVLRDGVYLMPEQDGCRHTLDDIAADVIAGGGNAFVLQVLAPVKVDFVALFDRAQEYAALRTDIGKWSAELHMDNATDVIKQIRKLRKTYAAIVEIDFFAGSEQKQTEAALTELELTAARLLSPDEPQAVHADIPLRHIADYQGRLWATRRRPWVDRLACAWLIRRFIDTEARLLWLASPLDCPKDALGFDFDGAVFSHIGPKVSFEVMLTSFALVQPALQRMAALVHYLDVGGLAPAEAAGVESILAGLRSAFDNDDQLLAMASNVFDGLLKTFEQGGITS